MNKLEEQLLEILKKAIDVAEQTGEFAIEQAPLLLQEFYRWHLTKHILTSVLLLFIIFAINFLLSKFKSKEETYERDFKYKNNYYEVVSFIIAQIFKVGFFIGFLVSLYDIIFILVAPKLYLIEYFIK